MLIKANHQIASVYKPRFFGQDLRHNTGSLRRHRNKVPRDIGVIGSYPNPIMGPPVNQIADRGDQDQAGHYQQPAIPARANGLRMNAIRTCRLEPTRGWWSLGHV